MTSKLTSYLRMEFRYLVNSPDLNAHGSLHGGVLMRWIDEAAGMHAMRVSGLVCATRHIGRMDFISGVKNGEIVRIETIVSDCGDTSFIFRILAKEDSTNRLIASVDTMVFVTIDEDGNPKKHGITTNHIYEK